MPRYALITGASSGIGLALAEALARRGQALVLVARQRDALESIACELAQRFGVDVLFRTCDLSEPLQLSGLVHELDQNGLQIELLVNSAGIGSAGAFIDQDWTRERELIELNVLALARLCHAIGYRMAQNGGGRILNIAATGALHPGPWMSSYHASKAYVLHFSEGLREELKGRGVKVSVLCPGPTQTAFFREAGLKPERFAGKRMMSPEELAFLTVKALKRNPAIIIPGWRNRLLAWLPRLAPRWLVRKLAGRRNRLAVQG
ncbi:SDR family NAD(P)-dependent oxidoreductase [Pseudomonas schmalbachii]|uniref:SDR family oxidoreductase n=1 Tax=Pseudomonas schmalbachii TaxID=2816993 RepID=A0ABS3TV74_9PSED|nr:SDR family oxidoreductase [Pseudomonas schmalbachii]MBO3277580.1 SDR family oxidoreductase [Pseudomonas schmalbachii]